MRSTQHAEDGNNIALRPATKSQLRAVVKQVAAKRKAGHSEVNLIEELKAAGFKLDHLAMPGMTPINSRAPRMPRESENSVIDHTP